MIVKLDEKACSLDADELVAFVRLSFNADKDGYVYGSNKELSNKIGMSVAKVKKAIEGLFEKQMLSIGSGKVFIWKHEDNIEFAEGEESKPHKNEPERIALNNVPSVQQVDDKAKKVCEYFNKVIVGRGMPLVHALTSKRKSMINSRLKEYGSEQMKLMIDKAAASSFLNGRNAGHIERCMSCRLDKFVHQLLRLIRTTKHGIERYFKLLELGTSIKDTTCQLFKS